MVRDSHLVYDGEVGDHGRISLQEHPEGMPVKPYKSTTSCVKSNHSLEMSTQGKRLK